MMKVTADKKNQDANGAGHGKRIDQAETRIEQAEKRTDQAEMRSEQAEKSEQAISASELSYRRLFEAAKDGILILDVDTGRINDVNPFLIKLLGFSHSEMVGKTVGELSPFKDIESNQAMLEQLQQHGYVRYEDLPLKAKDGRHIAVEFVSNVYPAGDRNVIQCNIRDITERKRAEEVLHKTSQQRIGRQKARITKELSIIFAISTLVFVFSYYFDPLQAPVRDFALKYLDCLDDLIEVLSIVLLGSGFLFYRYWREFQEQVRQEVRVREALRTLHDELDKRVQQRTAELAKANEDLLAETAQRVLADEVLRESERRFREMLENVELIAMTLDKEGTLTFCNDYLLRLTGWTREEVMGKDWFSHFIPNENVAVKKLFFETIEAGEIPIHYENPIKTRTGELREIVWNNTMLRDTAGNIVGTASLGEDVTERKSTAEILEQLRRQQELILNSAGEGIHGVDLEGKIVFTNPKGSQLLGWNADDLLGKPAHATMHHTHADGSKHPVEDCPIYASMRDGGTRRITNDVFCRKDGSRFRVDYVSAPTKDEKGQIRGAIVTFKDITEQFTAEARQKLQAEQYRLLFETNPSPMWVFDTKSLQILAVNQAAVAQYGYSRDEFLKLNLKDLRPPDDVPDLMRGRALSSPQAMSHFSGQFRHQRRDGSLLWVETYSGPVVWDGVGARIVTAIDVTERKEAGERMQAILESALDCVITMDHRGRVVEFNPAAEKTFGYRRNEAVGQLLSELIIPPSLREGHQRGLTHYLSTGEASVLGKRVELTGMRSDNSEFPLELAITRIGAQEPPMFTGFIRDITERKEAEGRLREQARLLDLANDAIMVRDMEGRVEFWNQGAEKLYGWTAAEVDCKKASDFLYKDEPGATAAARAAVIKDGKWAGECTHNCQDGGTVTVRSRWTLVRDELEAPKSVLIINTDVTEQKKLETHLLRVQRLESIGTLASGVAHDLNNILAPILMCAEMLKGNPEREEVSALVSMIEESAKRGAHVVKQVFTFARGIEGERVVIKPSHLIQEMIDIAQQTFPKSIEMRSRYSKDLWSINCDPTQLHQVLLNLSVNARDAMPNGGSLTISAENFDVDEQYASLTLGAKPGPHVMFHVTDTGAGMSRATIDKIFDPFFTTKEVGKGTGLGLSTVLGIVKSHGGFISVDSEIGTGTTFKVFLPARVSEESSQKSEMPLELLEGNGEVVLVIDDEPSVVQMTKMILEKSSYRVLTAKDGPDALGVIAQHMEPTKVVLTDMSMPFMDSIVLIRAIKKMKPATMFIASTGQGEETRMGELESLGVKNFLTKPYDTHTLLTTVRDTLSA